MKTFRLVLCLALAPATLSAAPVATASTPAPFRGAYMHLEQIFKGKQDRQAQQDAICRALDRFPAAGLRVAMPYATTTSGSAYFASKVVPDRQYPDWDPIAFTARQAHQRHLEFWPTVCVIPSGSKQPNGILRAHPEWALRDPDGKSLGYLSPWHPEARRHVISVLSELVQACEPDGLLLDYMRFPSERSLPDQLSHQRLLREFPGFDQADAATRQRQLQAFKERGLTELMGLIRDEMRRLRPSLKLGLYTWGPQVLHSHSVAQDWQTWIQRGYLDMVSVSGYCYPDNYKQDYMKVFERRLQEAKDIFQKTPNSAELTFTLGVRTSHGRISDPAQIEQYMSVARKIGVPGVAVFTWSYLEPFFDDTVKNGYFAVKSG